MRLLFISVFLAACASVPVQKEWNNKYDPASWRKQFEVCRDTFYTHYPDEIVDNDWHKCMRKNHEEIS
tara:strand:- start:915 stop:1118 length:204 start_codon:yes stop_codon:yes gene_type:complete